MYHFTGTVKGYSHINISVYKVSICLLTSILLYWEPWKSVFCWLLNNCSLPLAQKLGYTSFLTHMWGQPSNVQQELEWSTWRVMDSIYFPSPVHFCAFTLHLCAITKVWWGPKDGLVRLNNNNTCLKCLWYKVGKRRTHIAEVLWHLALDIQSQCSLLLLCSEKGENTISSTECPTAPKYR